MSLRNRQNNFHNPVKQVILPRSLANNLELKIFCCNCFMGMALALLLNLPYIAIALLCMAALTRLPTANKLLVRYFSACGTGKVQRNIVLLGLIVFCALIPQVETNIAIFAKPTSYLEYSDRLS